MQQLSVIIPTYNDEHHIAGVLDSVRWADEVMVVDAYSTDQTVAIAREHGARVLTHNYTNQADQRNWSIPQARHEWVFLLDADERVRPELRREIQELLQGDIPFDAFQIKRRNFFMGKRIHFSGWRGDKVIRLIRRDVCRYNNNSVHEEIDMEGIRLAQLEYKLDHYSFKNIDHFLDKMRHYAEWSARDRMPRTGRVGWFHLWIKPIVRFFKHYFMQLGFLDGKRGFIISVIMAWGVFLRYVKMKEWRMEDKRHSHP